jgi:hypothetical protein
MLYSFKLFHARDQGAGSGHHGMQLPAWMDSNALLTELQDGLYMK